MGITGPDDVALSSHTNNEARGVAESSRDRFIDDWLILPDIRVPAGRDRQIGRVIVHRRATVAKVEVKGHRIGLRCLGATGAFEPQPHAHTRAIVAGSGISDLLLDACLIRAVVQFSLVAPRALSTRLSLAAGE